MDANPHLKLIQRIGERADMIDLAAAAARGIAVSCLPRPSLHYTAEHAILLMLALAKR
jgi:lactate dehydrogenase-like 2-hydroxyacid dehydrogenase